MQTTSLLNHPERHRQARYSADNIPDYLGSFGRYSAPDYSQSNPRFRYPNVDVAADWVPRSGGLRYPGDQDRLFRAIQRSYQSIDGYREVNRKLVEEYGGPFYEQEKTGDTKINRYVNLVQQTVETYQMLLSPDQPQVMISTVVPELRGFASHYKHALNLLIEEIGLGETMSQWVMDAFFCVGIIKTHLGDAGLVQIEADRWMDPGRPFASNIALDDFVYDIKSNKWGKIRYAGDMYSMAWSDAEELFGEEALSPYAPRHRTTDDIERVDTLSRGTDSDTDDFEDMGDFADIWVPRYKSIFTYVVQSRRQFILTGNPVAREPWTGDEHGMYHLLSLGDVPENIMPASPASHLEQLDALVNDLWRKCARQARIQRDVNLYTPGGEATANQIQLADDGEWVPVNDTSDISMQKQGGVDPGNYAFLEGSQNMFDRMSGNIPVLAGLHSNEKTARQAGMVKEGAGNKVDKMSQTVTRNSNRLMKALGLMLWQDEFLRLSMEVPIAGTRYSANSLWQPGDREGNFADYNLKVDVFARQYKSPAMMKAMLDEYIQMVLIPLLQPLMSQGGYIDMIELNAEYSRLMNYPNLRNIVKFGGMMDTGPPAVASIPHKPPTSARHYVRHNVSGNGQGPLGQSSQMMNSAAAATAGPQTPGGMT